MLFAHSTSSDLCIPCFIRNSSKCWEKVLNIGHREEYKKNDIFFESSYGEEKFLYVKSGMCCTINEIGEEEKIHFFFDEGSLFRETIFISNYGLNPSYHYRVLKDSILYSFDKGLLFDKNFYMKYPDLVMNCMYSISVKSIMSQIFSNVISMKSKEKQVAYYLNCFYQFGMKKKAFPPPITQSQLALLLGIHLTTMNRIIATWKHDGVIGSFTKSRLEIFNIDALRDIIKAEI